jgi:hypothetical protein
LLASTGIEATFRTIDTHGTNRYFDLQGRMLNGKPEKGLYIGDGKKVLVR